MNINRGISKYKDDTDDNTKKQVDKIVDKFFSIRPNFLQYTQGFSASLIFEVLIRQFHGMLQTICKYFCPEFLYHHIHKIILEIFSDPAHHGYGYRKQQQVDYARTFPGKCGEKTIRRYRMVQFTGLNKIIRKVHDFSEYDGVQQGKAGIQCGQQ